jgi:cobalt/nickel transport system permease protein
MHIPDGYLSPATCVAFGAAMVPAWTVAVKKVKTWLRSSYVPLMAIGAAFSFTIMMYNIPIPDGTTAHAVGGGLLAVVLGPWAAMICVTIALAIQALLFGDGGILTFTVNCFNMALVLPFISYWVYRLISGNSDLTAARRWVGAAAGGFLGLVAAAFFVGVELGLQPILFHTAKGVPLYCPYPLSVAVPTMLLAHLVVAGPLEALVTALVVRYMQSHNVDLLKIPVLAAAPSSPASFGYRKLLWGVGLLIVLAPLGLLASGGAWGEWGADEVRKLIGFIPSGMQRLADTWPHAPLADYSLPGFDSIWSSAVVYIFCALLAVGIICLLTYLFMRFQAAEKREPI